MTTLSNVNLPTLAGDGTISWCVKSLTDQSKVEVFLVGFPVLIIYFDSTPVMGLQVVTTKNKKGTEE
jgi:hypothetical protein